MINIINIINMSKNVKSKIISYGFPLFSIVFLGYILVEVTSTLYYQIYFIAMVIIVDKSAILVN